MHKKSPALIYLLSLQYLSPYTLDIASRPKTGPNLPTCIQNKNHSTQDSRVVPHRGTN